MDDNPGTEVTSQVLLQIRDEMRAMRSSFEGRFEGVEARLEAMENRIAGFESRMGALERRIDSFERRIESTEKRMITVEHISRGLEGKLDALQANVEFLQGKIDVLEVGIESVQQKNETQHQELFHRFELINADLKRFAGLVNETILHYAEEMDSVRDRLDIVENRVGISSPSE